MIDEKRMGKSAPKECVHNLIMENRHKLSISGVNDVDSFDEETIVLFTDMGTLTVKGSELHINKLSVETGEVTVEGTVDSCLYSDTGRNKQSGGFFSRMFQ